MIDKEGVTGRGESFGEEFDRFEAESLNITRVADIGQAMAMLLRKRVDYVICGYYSGWTNILKSGWQDRFEKLPLAVNTPVAYQAFAKKSPYLKYLDYYNERLKALEASGEIKRIIEKNLQYWQQQSDLQQESRFP